MLENIPCLAINYKENNPFICMPVHERQLLNYKANSYLMIGSYLILKQRSFTIKLIINTNYMSSIVKTVHLDS